MNNFRVILSADSVLWCQSLAVAFTNSSNFEVVECVELEDLIEIGRGLQPDIVLCKLPQEISISRVSDFREICPFTLIILLLEDESGYKLEELIDNGVRGCLSCRLLPRQIVNAVELISAGIFCMPAYLHNSNVNYKNIGQNGINTLTGREREVLVYLAKSLSNQEIAQALCVSESTVKTHLHNCFKKLGVKNRSEALALIIGSSLTRETAAHF